ncbi:bifunctional acetate--CoA ligase family protein/GNAT family N-acetyltransferase [Mycobacterium sp. KBS0706]|uniref:bifunctional acetate--CoA ligase family protein/GNAT family N-acetyltransferase n=1 Tax=Mycobacterium sp. KBS0706 TaxID=2578109 RepID=UPI00110FF28E|nr:bifunctional acetate--CoA ligase family protein/GNAT family N-acetyltransferase [Mycobacterium sp. KBS0706]TSD85490.1 bifunctional acetate--CoA ligase family protein/GNAT family N-acetyltransferase [Mycobacterium sp. KBS0706]
MSVRNLDALFRPSSIAVIGASRRAGSVGAVVARNLFAGGFDGPVMPVNPNAQSIGSTLAYRSVAELPVTPDLAVIATPPATVPGLIAELGARGTRAAVVVTAGFGEGDSQAEGAALRQVMLDAARPHLLRVLGPNCLGLMAPHHGVNASFAHIAPLPGVIAFVSQSGAIATAVLDWATHRGIGFSHVVSLGDMADVDFGDMLDWLAADGRTRAILLYVEAVTHARKFMSAARIAARTKPVVVIKGGRTEAAARAAASHTGALAGSDAVYDAAFRRAGMLRVFDLAELFDAVETLASRLHVEGDRLAILTNGGGTGVLATEALDDAGGTMAALTAETMARLEVALPRTWSRGNPVDIIGDATGERYARALDAMLADPGKDAVLAMNCPTAVADPIDAAQAVVRSVEAAATRDGRRPPVLTCWLGEGAAAAARRLFAEHRIPSYATPGQAARAFMHLARYRRNQALLMETPPALPQDFAPDPAAARAVIAAALAEGRAMLTEPESKQVLEAYRIPVVRTCSVAADPDAAADAASGFQGPVALKVLSPDITHKSDLGGVRLNLEGAEQVRAAAREMLVTIGKAAPEARLLGFTVQDMARKPGAHELILGIGQDRLFGPTILFGHGGTAVEVLRDTAVALPPLNAVLARDLMARTRVWLLLQGYRARPRADLDAAAFTLVKLSQLAADLSEVVELDINPLLADEDGVVALDARIRVQPPLPPGTPRFAIRPYPQHLVQHLALRDGRTFTLRPVRPEDEPAMREMLQRSSPEDIRLRFFGPMRLDHDFAARLTQIDYDREMALVAEEAEDGRPVLLGTVRIVADPDNVAAEYGIMVRSDLKGQGLGYRMMTEVIAYARSRGLARISGEILRENATMLRMAEELGFKRETVPDEPGLVRVTISLGA